MNKRLRKKLRKGEFKELAFKANISLKRNFSENEMDAWLDDFIGIVEQLELSVFGFGHYNHVYHVSSATERGTVTIQQRDALADWLADNVMVESHQLSEFYDRWYPPKNIFPNE